MSEDSPPLTNTDGSAISHRRLLVGMAVILIIGMIAGFGFFSPRAGFGVLIGGLLSFANYLWQKQSLKAIFDRAIHGERSRFLALKYILRYVVLGAGLTLIYLTNTVSIVAVIFGLSSFALAVVIEGFRSIFSSSDRQES
jgi:hypothetical protein